MISNYILVLASLISPLAMAPTVPSSDEPEAERLVFPAIPEQGLAYLIGMARDNIMRIPPVDSASSKSLRPFRFVERPMGNCINASTIAAVRRAGGTALDMVTTHNTYFRAYLSDNCQAAQFYSGFYVEKASDGKVCTNRDILHSRSGAQCTVKSFRQLTPAQ